MTRMAIFVAVGTAVIALTPRVHAQGADERGSGSSANSEPSVEVRNRSDWAVTTDSMRPPVGAAILRPQLVLPDTYGTWAQPPIGFATTPVTVHAHARSTIINDLSAGILSSSRQSLRRRRGRRFLWRRPIHDGRYYPRRLG
jgi:hypothetical protein